jgi:hypothetical protein
LKQIMRAVLLAVFLSAPALADPISGADDPAFRVPFERALQSDDPTALTDLHAAAEAGNTAALVALPVVSSWLRTTLSFDEREKLGRVNGIRLNEAFAAADPVAALWALGGVGSDMNALLQRAFGLYAAGEPDKASALFMTWLNHTGGFGPLPDGFFDQPIPDWMMAFLLRRRMYESRQETVAAGEALLINRLKADDNAAWIALAAYSGLHPELEPATDPDPTKLARIFKAAGISQDEASRRMLATVPVLMTIYGTYRPLDRATSEAAEAIFRIEPEFQPLLAVCAATCPASANQCAAAFVAGFGLPQGRAALAQPLTSLISTADFFATPRGRQALLGSTAWALGGNPAKSSVLSSVRQIDACLADAVLAAQP